MYRADRKVLHDSVSLFQIGAAIRFCTGEKAAVEECRPVPELSPPFEYIRFPAEAVTCRITRRKAGIRFVILEGVNEKVFTNGRPGYSERRIV
jgi:hypothetical protein